MDQISSISEGAEAHFIAKCESCSWESKKLFGVKSYWVALAKAREHGDNHKSPEIRLIEYADDGDVEQELVYNPK